MVTTWLRATQLEIPKFKYLVASLNTLTDPKKVVHKIIIEIKNYIKLYYYFNGIAKEEKIGLIDNEIQSQKSAQQRSIQSTIGTHSNFLEAIIRVLVYYSYN